MQCICIYVYVCVCMYANFTHTYIQTYPPMYGISYNYVIIVF